MTDRTRCLIVEDSPLMRQLLTFALGRIKNIDIVEADDGVAGLKQLAAGKFDIVIVDINMPIMDGLKLIKRIRCDAQHKDVPVIVVTTEGNDEDRQRAAQLGVNAYVTKPLQGAEITAKVEELLRISP